MIEHRSKQLMQSGERQLRLGFDAETLQDLHVDGLSARLSKQRRFADARLTSHDEHATRRPPRRGEQLSDDSTLRVPAAEHIDGGTR
jgi:hypothetical protein